MVSPEEMELDILIVFRSGIKIQGIVKCEKVESSLLEFSAHILILSSLTHLNIIKIMQ